MPLTLISSGIFGAVTGGSCVVWREFLFSGQRKNNGLKEKSKDVEECAEEDPPATVTGVSQATPLLKDLYAAITKRAADMDFVDLSIGLFMHDANKAAAIRVESNEFYEKEVKPVLARCFELYDINAMGMLNETDAKALLSHLLSDQEDSTNALASIALEQSIKAQVSLMASMIPQEYWEYYVEKKAECDEQNERAMQTAIDACKKDVSIGVANYRKNRSGSVAAVFKVMDFNANGSINLTELLDAFDPNNGKLNELMVALGFMTEKEKLQFQHMKSMQAKVQCMHD